MNVITDLVAVKIVRREIRNRQPGKKKQFWAGIWDMKMINLRKEKHKN